MVLNTTGSVERLAPPNPFGTPTGIASLDSDSDGVPDYYDADGNNLLLPADPNDPADWDAAGVWVDYDYDFDLEVGATAAYGLFEVNGRTKVRVEDIKLGEVGFGDVLVSGTDSLLSNDPNIFDPVLAFVLAAADGDSTPLTNTKDYGDVPSGGSAGGRRSQTGDFDLRVGISGRGRVTVNTGGRVEVMNRLTVAEGGGSVGEVLIDGVGSTLWVTARSDGSEIGVGGLLAISNAGYARFGKRLDVEGVLDIGAAAGVVTGSLGVGSSNNLDVQTLLIKESGQLTTANGLASHLNVTGSSNPGGLVTDAEDANSSVGEGVEFFAGNLGTVTLGDGRTVIDTAVGSLPFANLRRVAYDTGVLDGEQVGTMHFTGGHVRFTGGLANYGAVTFGRGATTIDGAVTNQGLVAYTNPEEEEDDEVRGGTITITGEGTRVTLTDELRNDGVIYLGPGTTLELLGGLSAESTGVIYRSEGCPKPLVIERSGSTVLENFDSPRGEAH